MLKQNRWLFLVVVLSAFIFLFNLGGIPLLDPDEPVYVETPKEMLQANDLISPRIYGDYWYDKPPMYYWLVAGAFQVFGMNEFSARFPSAFLGVLGVLAVYFAGARLFSPRAGFFSALILATSVEYFYLAKAAVTDITLTFCLMVSLLAFLQKKYYLFYIFAGLAVVTKGPIGFLFPAGIIFFYLLATRQWSEILRMKIPAGIMLFLIIAMPWYYIMYQIHGSIFIDTFIGFHNITRFAAPEHPESAVWYYFIPVLLLGFFPWTAVLVQSIWNSLQAGRMQFSNLLFLNIWALFVFMFFTISKTKLVSYILPMYPPLALIVGWYLDSLCSSWRKARPFSWAIILTILVLIWFAVIYLGVQYMPELTLGLLVLSTILFVMLLSVWYFLMHQKVTHAFAVQVTAMTLFAVVLVGILFPAVAPRFSSQEMAQQLMDNYDGSSPVYIAKFLRPGIAYYSNVYGIAYQGDPQLLAVLNHNGKAYYIVTESEYQYILDNAIKHQVIAKTLNSVLLLKP